MKSIGDGVIVLQFSSYPLRMFGFIRVMDFALMVTIGGRRTKWLSVWIATLGSNGGERRVLLDKSAVREDS